MKEAKFIELLNLYLDQQIEPAAAAHLEEEIARNPARRITYEQYCRMHRACTMLFEQSLPSSNVGVKLATTAAAADEKMLTFPAPRRSYAWTGYAAGLAAAACIAVVFVHRPAAHLAAPSARDEMVQILPAKDLVAPKSGGLVMAPVNYQTTLPNTHGLRRVTPAADAAPSLEWMREVQFTPMRQVSAAEITFEQHSTSSTDQGIFHSRLPVENATATKMELMNSDSEKAGWQFQR